MRFRGTMIFICGTMVEAQIRVRPKLSVTSSARQARFLLDTLGEPPK
jgi:hypothetical protein